MIEMDTIFGYLINKLTTNGIINKINIIVVSDHGMANLTEEEFIYLKDYPALLDLINVNKSTFGEVCNINPKDPAKVNELFELMKQVKRATPYLKGTVPDEFHYGSNRRIGQIIALVDEGFKMTEETSPKRERGTHGYNNSLESMRAIFMASGPNFERNKTFEPFQNIHLYSLMCRLLEINCLANNGTASTFDAVYKSTGFTSRFELTTSGFLLICSFILRNYS
jgi:predicted AlkP superfamily pyrophosphatase or phosphodiesterase